MERYVLQALFSVTREIINNSTVVTYRDLTTESPRRRETLLNSMKIDDLHVGVFEQERLYVDHGRLSVQRKRVHRFYRTGIGVTDKYVLATHPIESPFTVNTFSCHTSNATILWNVHSGLNFQNDLIF